MCLPSDLYIYAVLVCCVGILSVLLFTLTIVWQSVFSKRKARGKRTDKVMSGMGVQPNHRQAEDAGQSITLLEKCIVSQSPLDSAKISCAHVEISLFLKSLPSALSEGVALISLIRPEGAVESEESGFASGSAAGD